MYDFLPREKHEMEPVYTLEVFIKEGMNSEEGRKIIMSKTGTAPAIYDKRTHYVSNHRISLELLKEINDLEQMYEIKGYYSGDIGSVGAAYGEGDRPH